MSLREERERERERERAGAGDKEGGDKRSPSHTKARGAARPHCDLQDAAIEVLPQRRRPAAPPAVAQTREGQGPQGVWGGGGAGGAEKRRRPSDRARPSAEDLPGW